MRSSHQELTLGVVLKKGITVIALRGCAAVFVVALGCGVQTAAQSGLSIPSAAADRNGSTKPRGNYGTHPPKLRASWAVWAVGVRVSLGALDSLV